MKFSFEDYKKAYDLQFNINDDVYVINYLPIDVNLSVPTLTKMKVVDISNTEKVVFREKEALMLLLQSSFTKDYVLLKRIFVSKEEALTELNKLILHNDKWFFDVYLEKLKLDYILLKEKSLNSSKAL